MLCMEVTEEDVKVQEETVLGWCLRSQNGPNAPVRFGLAF